MATEGGPNIITDGLVFGFDTGYPLVSDNNDSYKFNKGAPATNLNTDPYHSAKSAGDTVSLSAWGGDSGNGSFQVNTSPDGGGMMFINHNTSDPAGTGGTFTDFPSTRYTLTNGVTYTRSWWCKSNINQTLSGHICSCNRDAGNTYIVGGNISLTTEWQRFSETFTYSGPTSTDWQFRHINYNASIVYIANVQLEANGFASPLVNGSRSVSGSLIDLTRTTDIDLSNVSFDSNAQMTFDGTDDSILLTPRVQYSTGSAWTAELIFEPTTTDSWNPLFGGYLNAGGYWMFHSAQNLTYYEGSSAVSGTRISYKSWSIGNTFTLNQDHHLTIAYTPTTAGSGSFALYYNGGEKVDTFDYGFYWANSLDMRTIGSGDSNRYGTNNIKIFKFYNRALAAEEVKENYNALKSRFGLT
jgi:hypothetical protein